MAGNTDEDFVPYQTSLDLPVKIDLTTLPPPPPPPMPEACSGRFSPKSCTRLPPLPLEPPPSAPTFCEPSTSKEKV